MALEPDRIPELEALVEEQCRSGSYDLDENLTLLKLYQFFPDKAKPAVIARVLLLALMRLPETDYLLCTYLIPDRITAELPVLTVCDLANKLETCAFKQFWAELKDARSAVEGVKGFDDAIVECTCAARACARFLVCSLEARVRSRGVSTESSRARTLRPRPRARARLAYPAALARGPGPRADVLAVVKITYQVLDLQYLGELLNTTDAAALDKWVAKIGRREGSKVHVHLSDDNQAKVKEPDNAHAVRVEQLSKAIRSMANAF